METFLSGMLRGMNTPPGETSKTLDWDKAAQLIREHGIKNASAGLIEDWHYTSDTILRNGKPAKEEFAAPYFSSHWATPYIEDDDTGTQYECFLEVPHDEARPGNEWPASALAILNGEA